MNWERNPQTGQMIPTPVPAPFELTLDRIAQRYGVLPWEVENGSLEWIEIISEIMKVEADQQNKSKTQNKIADKLRGGNHKTTLVVPKHG